MSCLVQSTQYYPFGMAFAESTNQGTQPYKYNGKELDLDHGLNWYDYEARYLTNDVARFTTIDPLAEKFYNWSPYVYCKNNPILRIDPDGKQDISTLVGNPNQFKSSIFQQKAQKQQVASIKEHATPAAYIAKVEGELSAGISFGSSIGGALINKGNEEGSLHVIGSSSVGVGTIHSNIGVKAEVVFDTKSSNQDVTPKTLQGESYSANIGFYGISVSASMTKDGVISLGVGAELGGASATPVTVSVGQTNTEISPINDLINQTKQFIDNILKEL